MKRQSLIATGIVVLLLLSSALWYQQSSCGIPDEVTVNERYSQERVLSDATATDRGALSPEETWWRVVTNDTAARTTFANETRATEFARNTDFDTAYLLVVQTADSSTPGLVPKCYERNGVGATVTVSLTDQSGPRTDDLVTHTLVMRIDDRRTTPPSNVSVRVTGHDQSPILDL